MSQAIESSSKEFMHFCDNHDVNHCHHPRKRLLKLIYDRALT